jgi:hypothetical protein
VPPIGVAHARGDRFGLEPNDTEWRVTENSRRANYYRLTAGGRRALGQEVAAWNRFVNAVGFVLAAER